VRAFGRAAWLAALMVGLLAQPCAAKAAVQTSEAVTATGSLTYTWHGDPSRGCAAVGVCGVSGEISLQPQGESDLNPLGGAVLDVPLSGSATVRVLRDQTGAPPGECVDLADEPFGIDLQIARHHGLRATLQAPPSSGRCAGPLAADLVGLNLPVRRSGSRRPSFDLRATQPFTGGPFSGTLVSTVVLRPTPGPMGVFTTGSSSSSSGPGPVHASTHLEYVELDYRLSAPSTSLQTQFAGSQDPSCQILDTCGTSGSLEVSVRPPGELMVFGSRLVRGRVTRARVLRDLRQGRFGLNGFAAVQASLDESLSWPDGSTCRDSTSIPLLQLLLGPAGPAAAGGRIPVTLSGQNTPGAEILRTHCPGPADADVIGSSGILARGSITSGALLSSRSVISLSNPGGFTGPGYDGSRSGSLELDLTLTHVHAGTQEGP
jgi:hypothetical protein